MDHSRIDKEKVIETLNRILEEELAGSVRYTHYSFMIFGYNRIPIVSWFRGQANENMMHAQEAGELITAIGGHPSLGIGSLLETHQHSIEAILRETLGAEHNTLKYYYQLLELVQDKSVRLEEYARRQIEQEENHIDEIDKMLRKPGDMKISPEVAEIREG